MAKEGAQRPLPALSARADTLFEMPLSKLVKQNEAMAKAVMDAATFTTPDFPFLHQLDAGIWQQMRAFIISELSAKFYAGYVARDLGCPIVFDSYYFGLANEQSRDNSKTTSQKLRVIIAKQTLLENYDGLRAAGDVKMAVSYFKGRWVSTLQNMSDLFHDKASKSLRQIELCVAANRVALTTIDGKLDRLNMALGQEPAWGPDNVEWGPDAVSPPSGQTKSPQLGPARPGASPQ